MDDIDKLTLQEPQPLYNPKYTWKCMIGGENGLSIYYIAEQTPCWFHRKMQEFVLGFKWSKINSK